MSADMQMSFAGLDTLFALAAAVNMLLELYTQAYVVHDSCIAQRLL